MARRYGANGFSKHWMRCGDSAIVGAIDARAERTDKKANKKTGRRRIVR